MDEMTELIYNITLEHLAVQQRLILPELAMPRLRKLLEDYGQKMYDRGVTASLGSSMTDDTTPEPESPSPYEVPIGTIRDLISTFKPDPVTGDCMCDSCMEQFGEGDGNF